MKSIFLLVAAALYLNCTAQTKGPARLIGFEQTVAPGTQKQWSEGNENRVLKPGKNHFIYLVAPSRVYPVKVWIHGVEYDANIKMIRETPVRWKNPVIAAAPAVELVPETAEQVTQIIPAPAVTIKSFPEAALLARTNELVIVYKTNGKFYYNSLTKFSPLKSTARQ